MVCHAEAVPKPLRRLLEIGIKIGAEVLLFVQDDKIFGAVRLIITAVLAAM